MFDARPQHNEYLRHRSAQFRQQVERRLDVRDAGHPGSEQNAVDGEHAADGDAIQAHFLAQP